jgi:hypothetical protein
VNFQLPAREWKSKTKCKSFLIVVVVVSLFPASALRAEKNSRQTKDNTTHCENQTLYNKKLFRSEAIGGNILPWKLNWN